MLLVQPSDFSKLLNDLLNPADLAALQANLDPVRVIRGVCKNFLYYSTGSLVAALILLENDINLHPRANIATILAIFYL